MSDAAPITICSAAREGGLLGSFVGFRAAGFPVGSALSI